MPTAVELRNAMSGRDVQTFNRDRLREAQEADRFGRLMREAKPTGSETHQFSMTCSFLSSSNPQMVSPWIDFGRIAFTEKPVLLGISAERLAQPTDPAPLNDEASNYSDEYETWPVGAVVLRWRVVDGKYRGAKIAAFAYGDPTVGYKTIISGAFMGPAVRMGE